MAKSKKSSGTTRVRKPVSDEPKVRPVEDVPVEDEPAVVEKVPVKKVAPPPPPVPKAVPRARVVLEGAASLHKQGRKFVKGRSFYVTGKEAIEFFKKDSRFRVFRV